MKIKNKISNTFNNLGEHEGFIVYKGHCLDFLKNLPDQSVQLVITSPPYNNIGKKYEKKLKLDIYLKQQKEVIQECYRVLKHNGNIC